MTQSISISLPWPSASMSPNARGHWRKHHPSRQKARQDAKIVAQGAKVWRIISDKVSIRYTFHPPDRRFILDDDNAIGRCKAYRDGIADAMGRDDRSFKTMEIAWGEPVKGGSVTIELRGEQQ
jgi:crossover junction endodeoxyribonuclease RusA